MPITVKKLFQQVELPIHGKFQWQQKVQSDAKGIYVVSLSSDPDKIVTLPEPSFVDEKIHEWMNNAPGMKLDGQTPSIEVIKERLKQFWLPDETIVYIGQTTKNTLGKRVNQYYKSKIGKGAPHSGGHWIKTLECLEQMTVYWSELDGNNCPEVCEQRLLDAFQSQVSNETRDRLYDKDRVMPFANLEYPKGIKKRHRFTSQRG